MAAPRGEFGDASLPPADCPALFTFAEEYLFDGLKSQVTQLLMPDGLVMDICHLDGPNHDYWLASLAGYPY